MKNISGTDQNRLMVLEKVIERNHQAVVDWYDALCEIKRDKLWRGGYSSWDEYCDMRWGISPRAVNMRLQAEKARSSLKNEDRGSVLPENEGVCSGLSDRAALEAAKIEDEDERREAVESVVASTGGKPTAKAIREAAEKPNKPRAIRGIDPWAKDVCQQIRNIKRGIEGMASRPDGQWIGPLDKVVKALDYVHVILESTKFGETCRECKGKGCKHCRQSGWLPKWKVEELEA